MLAAHGDGGHKDLRHLNFVIQNPFEVTVNPEIIKPGTEMAEDAKIPRIEIRQNLTLKGPLSEEVRTSLFKELRKIGALGIDAASSQTFYNRDPSDTNAVTSFHISHEVPVDVILNDIKRGRIIADEHQKFLLRTFADSAKVKNDEPGRDTFKEIAFAVNRLTRAGHIDLEVNPKALGIKDAKKK